jgi:hypothetical protein
VTEYGEAFWVTDESGQFRYVAVEAEPEWAENAPQPIEAEPFAGPAAEPYAPEPAQADASEAPTATHWLPTDGLGGRQAPAY